MANSEALPDIQLAGLWRAIVGGLRLLLVAAALVGGATYGTLSLMAPRYTSESQLAIAVKRNNPFPDSAGRSAGTDTVAPRLDKEAINTHARALLAPDLLLRVADDLKLRTLPEFNSALGSIDTWGGLLALVGLQGPRPGESEEDRVLGVLTRQLEVAAVKESRWIPIRFTSADPQLAADFANRLAETYRAGLISVPIEETSEVVRALGPKVEQLRREVLDAEGDVERYRASTDQFRSGPQSSPVNDQRMAGLNDELIKSEAQRNEAEARWRTAQELAQSGSAEVLPDVQKSPVMQGLIGQRVRLERQIAEAGASLLAGHPRMQQLNADVAGLKRQIGDEVKKIVQGLEKDYRSAAIRVDSVQRQIDALKSRVVGQTGNESRLRELESTAKAKRAELERLQKQLEDNRTVVNIRQVPVEAQLVSRARPSGVPTWPRKGPTTLLAMASTLILGLAFLITRALVSSETQASGSGSAAGRTGGASATRSSRALVEPSLAPPQPQRPQMASAASHQPATDRRTSQSSVRVVPPYDPIGALAARLVSRTDTANGVRTLVTSEEPGVDVMASALSLCDALTASTARVVLVVWSLSGEDRAIARLRNARLGLSDLLQADASFEDVIGRIPGTSAHIIQAGRRPVDVARMLDPDRLNLTLDALDEAYDQIVIVGSRDDTRQLFEAVEGRLEAAVLVAAQSTSAAASRRDGWLFGYEVTDIDIVYVPPAAQPTDVAGGNHRRDPALAMEAAS